MSVNHRTMMGWDGDDRKNSEASFTEPKRLSLLVRRTLDHSGRVTANSNQADPYVTRGRSVNKLILCVVGVASFALVSQAQNPAPAATVAPSPGDLTGTWQGTLVATPPDPNIRTLVKITKGNNGAWNGIMYRVDQNDWFPMPVSALAVNSKTVTFSLPPLDATYEGKLSADGGLITGVWTHGPVTHVLNLSRVGPDAAWEIPAPPAPPTGDCNAPASSSSVTISLPGPPFMVAPSKDGCWVFVSLDGRGDRAGIAVLKRAGGRLQLVSIVPFPSAPAGITLTHDGTLLIGAASSMVVIADVKKMTDGAPDAVVGKITGGRGDVYVATTDDDKLLFVSEEGGEAVTVVDLEKARRNGFAADAVIGKIPVGDGPIALTFSPDNKWLYTTSELAPSDWGWPATCKPEGAQVPDSVITSPEGAVLVIDVARARTDPAHAVVARVPAGCSPVRMTRSPAGDHIFVTARNNNAVLEFDTAKLVSDSTHALVGAAPVGNAPVPVMIVDKGRRLVVGNSNRFGGSGSQTLTVLDTAKVSQGLAAVEGMIPAGSFPREMAVSSDGRTLFLTNFGSNSLQVMDIDHLPIDPQLPPEIAKNADSLAHRHDVKTVEVDPGVLVRYAGVYQASAAQTLILSADGKTLTARVGASPQTAVPESDTKFFVAGAEVTFPAVKEGGHADQLTVSQGTREIVYKRLDDEAAKPVLAAEAALEKRMHDNTPMPGSESALRQLITDLQSSKPVDSLLGSDAQQFLQPFQQQVARMGAVKSIAFDTIGPAGPDIFTVVTEKGSWICRIWLSADGKVDRMIAQPAN